MKIEITPEEAKVIIRALATLGAIRPEHEPRFFELANKFMDVLGKDLRYSMPDWWDEKKRRSA